MDDGVADRLAHEMTDDQEAPIACHRMVDDGRQKEDVDQSTLGMQDRNLASAGALLSGNYLARSKLQPPL